jgi:periplasmic protein TonB
MFENVARDGPVTGSRRLLYETLPLSLAIHASLIIALIASTHVSFPQHPPKITMSYLLIDGGAGAPPPPPPGSENAIQKPPDKPLAPSEVPKTIPATAPAPLISSNQYDNTPAEFGKRDGEAGGVLTGISGGILMGDGRIHFGRGGVLPMAALVMDYPGYPEAARRARAEGEVVIRYIIGKDGLVTDVRVIEPATWLMFDEAAVAAIRGWRFEPLLYKGEAREVVHEIVISFRLRQRVDESSLPASPVSQ